MTVHYRFVGGPLDGQTTEAPPIEYTRRIQVHADQAGEETPFATGLFVEGHAGAYVFDDEQADVMIWWDSEIGLRSEG